MEVPDPKTSGAIACPKCGRRLRLASPAVQTPPPVVGADEAPVPVVDVSRFRRGAAGPSRLPLLLGVGGGVVLLIAIGVVAFVLWGGPTAPATSAPPKDQVVEAPPGKAKPDNRTPSNPKLPLADPPAKYPGPAPTDAPPKDPAPLTPETPVAWKEIALADLPPDLGTRLLDKINAVRKAGGQPPVAMDAEASAACAAHAAYLARHAGRIAALQQNLHAEETALPGQSEAGRKAAAAATIAAKEPLAALDIWAALPAHRALILHPKLKTVGVGFAHNAKDQWASVFDWSSAADGAADANVTLYPGGGQTAVPLFFPGLETPDPLPEVKEKIRPSGFPITIAFPPAAQVKGAEAQLEDESGQAVEVWLSSPEKPANDRAPKLQNNTVCLIAKTPLAPGVRYAVHVKARVDQRDWERAWSFLTVGPEDLRRDFEDRFLARVNAARLQAGLEPAALDPVDSLACAAHARYVSLNFPSHLDLNRQEEKSDWPGYSEEGKKIAGRCICQLRSGTPEQFVDSLLATLGGRLLFFEAKLKRIGLGSCWIGSFDGSWVLTYPDFGEAAEVHPVSLYPAPDQKGLGTLYMAEAPSAVPPEGKGKPAGLPVTVCFPWHKPIDDVTGQLVDASGKDVAFWLSTPQKPLPGVAPFLVTLLPREPLHEGETYTATVTADFNGQPWKKTWSFTTKKIGELDAAAVEAKILERVNDVRKQAGLKPVQLDAAASRGCQQHARYLVVNDGRPALSTLGVQSEDSTYPGATPEGAKAGKGAVVLTVSDPADAVDGWMRMFFHRIPILSPDLHKIGFGCAQYPSEAWLCVMDVQSGK